MAPASTTLERAGVAPMMFYYVSVARDRASVRTIGGWSLFKNQDDHHVRHSSKGNSLVYEPLLARPMAF